MWLKKNQENMKNHDHIQCVSPAQSCRMLYCLKYKAGKPWDAEIWFTHLIILL